MRQVLGGDLEAQGSPFSELINLGPQPNTAVVGNGGRVMTCSLHGQMAPHRTLWMGDDAAIILVLLLWRAEMDSDK